MEKQLSSVFLFAPKNKRSSNDFLSRRLMFHLVRLNIFRDKVDILFNISDSKYAQQNGNQMAPINFHTIQRMVRPFFSFSFYLFLFFSFSFFLSFFFLFFFFSLFLSLFVCYFIPCILYLGWHCQRGCNLIYFNIAEIIRNSYHWK